MIKEILCCYKNFDNKFVNVKIGEKELKKIAKTDSLKLENEEDVQRIFSRYTKDSVSVEFEMNIE